MKQRIEPADLEGLTDAQKDRLRELWQPEVGNFMFVDTDVRLVTAINNNRFGGYLFYCTAGCCQKQDCIPLLSVGQMIETVRRVKQMDIYTVDNWWCVQLFNLETCANDGYDCEWENSSRELCDALWMAVKEIL